MGDTPLLDQVKALDTEEAVVGFMQNNFVRALPPEAAQDPNVSKYKTSADFYKGHLNAVERVGKSVIIPDANSPEEVKVEYRKRMGIPETPEGYKLTTLEGLHPTIKITPEGTKEFLTFAHQNGVPQPIVDMFSQWYLKKLDTIYKTADANIATNIANAEKALKDKWQGDYDKKLTIAHKLAKARGILDTFGVKQADGSAKILDPTLLDLLATEGEKYTEDDFNNMGKPAAAGENIEAQKLVDACMTADSPEFKILMNVNDPGRADLMVRRQAAYDLLNKPAPEIK